MKTKPTLLLAAALLPLLLAACSTAAAASGAAEPEKAPVRAGRAACPVTQPPAEPFVPPAPWPETYPYEGHVWYGDAGLWTTIPVEGDWAQLAHGEKSWWWSADFDVKVDATPDLVVTARRLDGEAPEFRTDEATNGFHESFNWAMLVGVTVATPGCWEITGEYNDHVLTFVVWVPQ